MLDAQGLADYSGGTARDSHPLPYSLRRMKPQRSTEHVVEQPQPPNYLTGRYQFRRNGSRDAAVVQGPGPILRFPTSPANARCRSICK